MSDERALCNVSGYKLWAEVSPVGEVVGITNMKITFGEGLGFAIPVEAVKFFLDHRDAFVYSNDNPSNPYRYLEPPSRTHQTISDENIQ